MLVLGAFKSGEGFKTMINLKNQTVKCADCGGSIGKDNGPSDGWQLEDGRTVCHGCCVADTKGFVDRMVYKKLQKAWKI